MIASTNRVVSWPNVLDNSKIHHNVIIKTIMKAIILTKLILFMADKNSPLKNLIFEYNL